MVIAFFCVRKVEPAHNVNSSERMSLYKNDLLSLLSWLRKDGWLIFVADMSVSSKNGERENTVNVLRHSKTETRRQLGVKCAHDRWCEMSDVWHDVNGVHSIDNTCCSSSDGGEGWFFSGQGWWSKLVSASQFCFCLICLTTVWYNHSCVVTLMV